MEAMDIDPVEETKIQQIQSALDNNVVSVVKLHSDDPDSCLRSNTVSRMVTATGFRVSTLIGSCNQVEESEPVKTQVKEEPFLKVKEEPDFGIESNVLMKEYKEIKVKEEPGLGFESEVPVKEETASGFTEDAMDKMNEVQMMEEMCSGNTEEAIAKKEEAPVKEETASSYTEEATAKNKDSKSRMSFDEFLQSTNTKVQSLDDSLKTQIKEEALGSVYVAEVKACETAEIKSGNQNPPFAKKEPDFECSEVLQNPADVKKEAFQERRVNGVLVEDGDFAEEPDWYLVGRTIVNAVSTTKGKNKLLDNEIVYFTFPSPGASYTLQSIVRFSTKRCGEIGRLPMDWAKWVNPLVYSNKVKVVGRCIAVPTTLNIMQEIMLFVSFYIHSSIFTEGDKSSWMFDAPWNMESIINPLLNLFRHLKIRPYQKADFTPEELNSGKRVLHIEDGYGEAAAALPIAKRRKGPEQNKDKQAISESSLNKIVGAADTYNLEWIKAILRLLMLRRTKETKDKEGRPILVLPPTDIKIIECEQSEAERDFYDALFKRSKVQFDQFVAQGKVLHNYASILELLLRLRQCCNHRFLVMSRADSQQYSDLNKLARRFLETLPDSVTPNQNAPSRAYIEEVVDGIRRGENTVSNMHGVCR
ncbi:hypothetical protein REPUB_Repub15cG0048100 [Reevesia pubescens]